MRKIPNKKLILKKKKKKEFRENSQAWEISLRHRRSWFYETEDKVTIHGMT
jgi:hypothetical protein